MDDKIFPFLVKAFSFVAGIVLTIVVIFRGVVGFLLASRSDFGVMGGFVVGFLGILLVAYLVIQLIKFVKNSF